MTDDQTLSDRPPGGVARAIEATTAEPVPTPPPPGDARLRMGGRRQRVAAAMRQHLATPVAFSLGGPVSPGLANPSAPPPQPAARPQPPAGQEIKLVSPLPNDAASVSLRPHPGSAILKIAVRDTLGVYPVPLRCANLLSGWWQLRPDPQGRNCWHGGEAKLALPRLQGAAFVELTLIATGSS